MKKCHFIIFAIVYTFSFVSSGQMLNCFKQSNSEMNSFLNLNISGLSLSDQDFEVIWSVLQETYSADLQSIDLNLKLIEKNSSEIGAWADKQENQALIVVSKANRFHRKMNAATMTLILCHELGHFLGGLPRYSNSSWASVEGQADYFATTTCVPELYKKISNKLSQPFVAKVDAKNYCSSLVSIVSQEVCDYTIEGAYSLIQILSRLHPTENQDPIYIQSRESSNASQLIEGHASFSCRYETFLRGLLHQERPSCWFSAIM